MAYGNVRTYIRPHVESNFNGKVTIVMNGQNNQSSNSNFNTDNITVNNINSTTITANNINVDNLKSKIIQTNKLTAVDGNITNINGSTLNYQNGKINEFESDDINTKTLNVSETANITNIINKYLKSENITTDYLTVNKSAHFFELIIDKIRSVQGTQINTATNCVIDYVEAYDSNDNLVDIEGNTVAYYRIYWKNTDDNGKTITNDWLVNDQAICESFNIQQGTSYDAYSKYYWRLVTNTSNESGNSIKYVDLNQDYNGNDKVLSTNKTYSIQFSNIFSFEYGGQSPVNDFIIEPTVIGQWDENTSTWTPTSTTDGIKITSEEYMLCDGNLLFTTNIPTKLNIAIVYEDETIWYYKGDNYISSYSISTSPDKNISYFLITPNIIETWQTCNWIDLSNVDMDATISGKSAIPSAGDNVCQLGYRYTNLVNPTDDDKARASAIIIAAYTTPDTGIVPPSYAQYQDITNYSLSSHRKSYFDATGCYIVGNFAVQAAGTTMPLDQYIQAQTSTQPAEILIEDNNAEVNMCILQVDSNDQIHDLNNFPGWIDGQGRRNLNISIYTQQSYSPQLIKCDLFGRTVTLLDIDPNTGTPRLLPVADTANGIYIYSVTTTNNKLRVTFDFRGTDQTISNGSAIEFYGQVIIGGTTYYPSRSITIASVKSVQGTDAELWKLYKDTEYAVVGQDKTLNVLLRYAIQHIVGLTSTFYTPTTQKLRIIRYNLSGTGLDTRVLTNTDYITTGGKSGNGYWEYTYTLQNWFTNQNKPIYIGIELLDSNNNVLDNTLVEIMLDTSSLFTVEDGLTQSIQANTTAINDETQARQTQYSAISQTVNNINSTVSSHTTSINNMSTEISQIDQKADRIGLHVDSVETDLNGVVTDLSSTGIDIEQGKITLSAENTVIDGDLDLSGDFESYNPTTQNRTRITTKRSGTSGLIMSGPDRVDQITGEPDPNTQEVDLIKMEFTTTAGARAGSIKIQSANSNNIYNNLWQESIGLSNDDNYISVRPEAITYGLRRNTYDYMKRFNNQSMSATWPAILANIVSARQITSGKWPAASINDCILTIYNGVDSDFGVVLPDPDTCAGKFYLIKNMSDKSGVMTCNGGNRQLFVEKSTTSKSTSVNLSDDIHFVYSDGSYWHVMWG